MFSPCPASRAGARGIDVFVATSIKANVRTAGCAGANPASVPSRLCDATVFPERRHRPCERHAVLPLAAPRCESNSTLPQRGDPEPVRVRAFAHTRIDNAGMRWDGGGVCTGVAGHGREQLAVHCRACAGKRDPCTPPKVASVSAAGRRAVLPLEASGASFGANGAAVAKNVPGNAEGALMVAVPQTPRDLPEA